MNFRALEFAARKHAGQLRQGSADPYIVHPIRVAELLNRFGLDGTIQAVGILHDTLEDTDTTFDELQQHFGKRIAEMVLALTDCSKSVGSRAARKQVDRHRIANSSPDVQTVKLADMIDNMSDGTLIVSNPGFFEKYLEEKRLMIDACSKGSYFLHEIAKQTHAKISFELEQRKRQS